MSKTTLRKRISLTVVAALTAGVLTSVATSPTANAHTGVVGTSATNAAAIAGSSGIPGELYVAQTLSSSGSAVAANFSTAGAGPVASARSLGLLAKSATSGVAQTATMLTSGTLSLYWLPDLSTATVTALTATGGTFGVGSTSSIGITPTMNQTRTTAVYAATATGVGQLWTAPSTLVLIRLVCITMEMVLYQQLPRLLVP